MQIGYHLSSEEHGPDALVSWARRAEEVGFDVLTISDHYHPWTHAQGQSPFVWSVLGAIARVTERVEVGTAVTCPTVRIHPAVIAPAAATTAVMMPGRFFLGVGTGEALNEHILGERWPSSGVRREMLEEAVAVMRLLWKGGSQSHFGRYYTVEQATIFTVPEAPPPIVVSGFGPHATRLAGRIGDGYMNLAPDPDAAALFREAGGEGKPCYGKLDACMAESETAARRIALETWPTAGLAGELSQILPLPAHFEQAVATVTEDDVAGSIPCANGAGGHISRLREFEEAGYDRVVVQQVGADQDRLFDLYEHEILPELAPASA
ncbi:MAG TPA: TIGR03557 family F420-dependent LLM class oxidoreductase [Gaiellales bacterium]|nr:TIGR03557 family F420-dependent LLM class oxidoreductase [Gaiellales bacterium]